MFEGLINNGIAGVVPREATGSGWGGYRSEYMGYCRTGEVPCTWTNLLQVRRWHIVKLKDGTSVMHNSCRGSHGALLVYDVTDAKSFDKVCFCLCCIHKKCITKIVNCRLT